MYKAFIENKGDSKHYAKTRHSAFVLDTEGKGANPIDTLLASLCSCLGHYVRDYMVVHQITHHGFSIDAEAGVTPDKASLADIKVRIDLQDVRLDEQQAAEMLEFMEICKVHKILKENPGVTISLTGCFTAGGKADGADREGLVKLGMELHSQAIYEMSARMFAGVGGFIGKHLRTVCRQRKVKTQTGK